MRKTSFYLATAGWADNELSVSHLSFVSTEHNVTTCAPVVLFLYFSEEQELGNSPPFG